MPEQRVQIARTAEHSAAGFIRGGIPAGVITAAIATLAPEMDVMWQGLITAIGIQGSQAVGSEIRNALHKLHLKEEADPAPSTFWVGLILMLGRIFGKML